MSSIAVKVKLELGGGLSPEVAGQLHTPPVEIEETVKEYHIVHGSGMIAYSYMWVANQRWDIMYFQTGLQSVQ